MKDVFVGFGCPLGNERTVVGTGCQNHSSCIKIASGCFDTKSIDKTMNRKSASVCPCLQKTTGRADRFHVLVEERKRRALIRTKGVGFGTVFILLEETAQFPGRKTQVVHDGRAQKLHTSILSQVFPALAGSLEWVQHLDFVGRPTKGVYEHIGKVCAMDAAADDDEIEHDVSFRSACVDDLEPIDPEEKLIDEQQTIQDGNYCKYSFERVAFEFACQIGGCLCTIYATKNGECSNFEGDASDYCSMEKS